VSLEADTRVESGASGSSDPISDLERDNLIEAVRAFGQERVFPGVMDRDREEEFPLQLIREAGQLDLLGGVVPAEYGGLGLDYRTYAEIVIEMARHDNVVALMMTGPSGLAGSGLLRYGTAEQREEYLTPLCRGQAIAAVGVTEPASGTDVADMHTTCRRVGDDYVINGAKTWTSNIGYCDWLLTFATLDRSRGREAICAFIIPADAPGLTMRPFKNKLGFRSVSTGEVFLDDVRVPKSALVGETEGIGFTIAMAAVENGRLGVASRALGLAQDCLDRSVAYANERMVGGAPIARFQLVQEMITDMVIGTTGARAMIMELAEARNRGLRARKEASLAKYQASEAAMQSASSAVQIHGAYGVHEDYIVGKHFRDAKVFQIVEGQNQLHVGMIAEYELGIRSDVKKL